PATIDFSGLFSNKPLLDKYNKTVPETWEELIETSKYIIEQEKANNNKNIIAYNGLYGDNGMCSLIEFIYSCRESYDSPFPKLTSKTAIDAIELIKRIKEEISSDEIFSNNLDYSIMKIFNGEALFIKFYYIPGFINQYSPYIVSRMPGIKKGISGSIQVGYNIGIVSNIDEDKLIPAIEAVKYMTSLEVQKELALKELIISGITSLYYEDNVCSNIRFCEFYRNPQIIMKPKNIYNLDNYYEKFTNYFYEFLYKNGKASDDLKLFDYFDTTSIPVTTNNNEKEKLENNETGKSTKSNIIISKILDYHNKEYTNSDLPIYSNFCSINSDE
ncbi:hypothetical protein PIROE2DRAFT_9855, partial [Piromyces sp. E2]